MENHYRRFQKTKDKCQTQSIDRKNFFAGVAGNAIGYLQTCTCPCPVMIWGHALLYFEGGYKMQTRDVEGFGLVDRVYWARFQYLVYRDPKKRLDLHRGMLVAQDRVVASPI